MTTTSRIIRTIGLQEMQTQIQQQTIAKIREGTLKIAIS